MANDSDMGTLEWLIEQGRELTKNDGTFIALTSVGVLGVAGAIFNDWTWQPDEVRQLPFIEDDSGRRFYYERRPGGRYVTMYLPTGRRVKHTLTPLASKQDDQLEAEVFALIQDNYPATT
jgi:hypothetical protein